MQPTNEATSVLSGHAEKIYFLRFHPLARDVLATGSYDMTVRIWDLKEGTERLQLEGHTDQVMSYNCFNLILFTILTRAFFYT